MKQELKDELCFHLGELIHELESEQCYFKRTKIQSKLAAIGTLLDIDVSNFSPSELRENRYFINGVAFKK